ncbi:MAG: hypothetical protein IJU96_01605 [Clostridia bacterium]|nr:hypothetical protein [Clostridia bacterium]
MKTRIAIIGLSLVCLSTLLTACGSDKMKEAETTVADALTTIKEDIESRADDFSRDVDDLIDLPDASDGMIESTTAG